MKTTILKSILTALFIMLLIVGVGFAKDKEVKPVKTDAGTIQQDAGTPAKIESDELSQPAAQQVLSGLRGGEQIDWQVISSGGNIGGTSDNYEMSGTASQTAVGIGSSPLYILAHGFWHESGVETPCDCYPGDANSDAQINVGDAVYVINYVFNGGPAPTPYAVCSGDTQGDCECNVGDAVYLIAYVFSSSPPPVTCEEWHNTCGPGIYK